MIGNASLNIESDFISLSSELVKSDYRRNGKSLKDGVGGSLTHTMPDLLDCMEQPFCQNLDTEPFIQMAFSAMHDIIEGEVSYRLFSNDEIKTYLLKWREQFNSDEKQPLFRF